MKGAYGAKWNVEYDDSCERLGPAVQKKKNLKNFFNKAYKSIPSFFINDYDLLTEEAISTK